MGKPHAYVLALLGLLLLAGWFLVGVGGRGDGAADVSIGAGTASDALVGGPVAPGRDTTAPAAARIGEEVVYTPEDARIFRATMEWALGSGMDTLPIGEIVARTGERFVGEPYTPRTLELEGPERLVINLREFDCVTYVESMLGLARVIRSGGGRLDDFARELRRIRYREGVMEGYTSRLHYFSEWIHDNAEQGLVRDVTSSLGGVVDDERIDFMSTHADAYPSFEGRPERVAAIRAIERSLADRVRHYIPEGRIGEVADGIRTGDVIAATSSVEGLDVAHTGIAVWRDGRLHLMHAPLVGRTTEVSDQPLAVRILRIDSQDGIMVARPL
jgi:hypothetical protein